MIQVIENKGLILTNFEEKWKEEGKMSVGYLARAAKDGTNIGIKLIEYFLDEFPDTDVHWLITGRPLGGKSAKKHTAATNIDEAAVSDDKEELMKDLAVFRSLVVSQQATILNLSRAQATKEA